MGDYALIVARKLRQLVAHDTLFAAHHFDGKANVNGFDVLPLQTFVERKFEFDHIILHYVNYGYQRRGVPLGLLSTLSHLQRNCSGRFLTIFHELYASGPPWTSPFWLRPIQKQIARSVANMSQACVVSSDTMLNELRALAPAVDAFVHPVISNFGEPTLSVEQITNRDPYRWAICGGTALVERSLRSLRSVVSRIPENVTPRQLFVLGGNDNLAVRSIIAGLPNIEAVYRPNIAAADASNVLSTCSFAWLDYFHRHDVPTAVLLKSTAFAAACAHGIICVLPHTGSAIFLEGDRFPGPFFVNATVSRLPTDVDRGEIATACYDWYYNHSSSEHLARGVAHALGLTVFEDTSLAELPVNLDR